MNRPLLDTALPESAPTVTAKQTRRILFASLIGTTIEFFDFYIYATAAVVVAMFVVMIIAMIAASSGTHQIAAAPAAVVIAVRFVITTVVSHRAFNGHPGAGKQHGQHHRPESGGQTTTARGVHFGSALVSLSLHSIRPNGAPAGSATTASMPPWRSSRGSTRT